MNSHEKWLREAAKEIAKAGHAGWGNTCSDGADEISRLTAEVEDRDAELAAATGLVTTLETKNESLRTERDALRAALDSANTWLHGDAPLAVCEEIEAALKTTD